MHFGRKCGYLNIYLFINSYDIDIQVLGSSPSTIVCEGFIIRLKFPFISFPVEVQTIHCKIVYFHDLLSQFFIFCHINLNNECGSDNTIF